MSETVKITVFATASSNISYRRTEELDTEVEPEDWEEMTERERYKLMDEMARDWLFEDIDLGAEVSS